MICKDCLIWQRKRDHLVYLNTKLWDDTARYEPEALEGLVKIIPALRKEFNSHEFLRDNECLGGRCILAS